jgi:hypothetical protein
VCFLQLFFLLQSQSHFFLHLFFFLKTHITPGCNH